MLDTVMELAYKRHQVVTGMERWEKEDMITLEEWYKKLAADEAKYVEEDIVYLTKLHGEDDAFFRDLLRQTKKKLEQSAERAKAAEAAAKKQRAAKRKAIRDEAWKTKRWEVGRKREEERARNKEEVEIFGGKMEVVDKTAWALPAWGGK